jgi:hypothetical protein
MKDWIDWMILAFWALFGAFLGFLIFAVALGGWKYLVGLGHPKPWNGLASLLIHTGLGFGWGLLSYKYRNRELGSYPRAFKDRSTGMLFTKRVMVIASCLAGVYFIWQLAKGL